MWAQWDWGTGPRIPVFATVKAKGSDGTAVLAPRALAGLPFAWDAGKRLCGWFAAAGIGRPYHLRGGVHERPQPLLALQEQHLGMLQ